VAVSGQTASSHRDQALRDHASGRVTAVFSVDVFNEGVDVPAINTVLFLRPTESSTVFLQQLGRGLRRA
jgi:superfamily II DNA or RNA helicase